MVRRVESRDGMKVAVRDAATGDEYRLVFRYWASSRSYVLNKGWNKLFVKGRELKVGDEIGMLWDPVSLKFHFMVLREVVRGTSCANSRQTTTTTTTVATKTMQTRQRETTARLTRRSPLAPTEVPDSNATPEKQAKAKSQT
ncbi:B3 domain-containing protein At2g33720-like [Syzygium oleosum]|uniref:B3 domain-containing protein At2g33720-like n=1 Tax=Syzygium oleosum TaxID=219896 RepID=UPI0024BB485B|nr:B3 domain-containing protein At2g33720-like [Syzygium oleosum]